MRSALALLLCLALLLEAARINSISTSSTNQNAPLKGSVLGGTELSLKGSAMETWDPAAVRITIGGRLCTVKQFFLRSNYILAITPSADSLVDVPDQLIEVTINGLAVEIATPATYSKFSYLSANTPRIISIAPNQEAPFGTIQLYGNWLTSDQTNFQDFRLSDRLFAFTEDSTFASSSFLYAKLGDNTAGDNDFTVRLESYFGNAAFRWTAKTYTIDGVGYHVKALALINSLSVASASESGGSSVTIKGYGFPTTTAPVDVNIEGNPCTVTSSSYDTVTCTVGNRSTKYTGELFPGNAGLRRYIWKGKGRADFYNLALEAADSNDIIAAPETFQNLGENIVECIKGFFLAPRTEDYYFYLSSDDQSAVFLSTDATEANKGSTPLLEVQGWNSYRDLLNNRSAKRSLVKDSLYYIEAWHTNGGGATHFTLGLEATVSSGNFENKVPEVQNLIIKPTQIIREKDRIDLILNTSPSGIISFRYLNAVTDNVTFDPSRYTEWQCDAIVSVLIKVGVAKPLCALTKSTNKLSYEITFDYAKTDSRSKIDVRVKPPSVTTATSIILQGASAPLKGSYFLTWGGVNSQDFDVLSQPSDVQSALNSLAVFNGELIVGGYANADTVSLTFTFGGSLNNGSVENIRVTTTNLTGGPDQTLPTAEVVKKIPASNNQFWFLAPSEFFRTAEPKTQLVAFVDDQPALCRGDCTFTYLSDSPTVIAVSESGGVVTLTAVHIPVNKDFIKVSFGGAECAVTEVTADTITCTLSEGKAGTHSPVVIVEGSGLATVQSGAGTVTFNLAITGVSPTSGAVGGGTLLTITGTGFLPSGTSGSMSVDIDGAPCSVQPGATGTELTCVTSWQVRTSTITVTVDSATATSSLFTYDANISPIITSVTPEYASTNVETTITIVGTKLDSTTSDKTTVSVGTEPCYVTDFSATQIKCNLKGGPSGKVLFKIEVPGRGNAVKQNYPVVYEVTSISPSTGSTEGGTLLTITGRGFSKLYSQTLIQFGKDIYCELEGEQFPEQLKCRTPPKGSLSGTVTFYVLGRIQNQATCSVCSFTYADSATPSISSLSTDNGLSGSELTITGSGFGTDQAKVVVKISDQATISTISNSQIKVTLATLAAGTYPVQVYVNDKGKASGAKTFTVKLDVSRVTPNEISKGGADLTLAGSGFATGLVVTVGSTACTVKSVTASEVKCRVAAYSTNENARNISITQDTSSFTCTDATKCAVKFLTSKTSTITAATLASDVLTVTGTGFGVDTADIVVTIGGADCTVLTASDTSLTCNAKLSPGSQKVEVSLKTKGYATGTASVTGTLEATSISAKSSYAGRSPLTITGKGLGPESTVTVCGVACTEVSGTYTQLTCNSPALATSYSQDTYTLKSLAEDLKEGITSTAATSGFELKKALDDVYTTYFKSTVSTCYIQIDAGEGRKIRLGAVRIFPAEDSSTTYKTLAGSTISSSDDATTWTTEKTFDSVIEGFNYWRVPVEDRAGDPYTLEHRYFRFIGASGSNCRLAEIAFSGVNLLTSSDTSQSCPVKITNGSSTADAGTVTYDVASTPVIKSVTPLYSTIVGGIDLTFEGENVQGTVNSVKIDGVNCASLGTTSSTVTCKTGEKLDFNSSGLEILSTTGLAVTTGASFFYGDRWSSQNSWNGEVPPQNGETVLIPKGMTILLDIPTAKLELLSIEGNLIALDEVDITLDAKWVFIKGGLFQVGTEAKPFAKKFTLTLHGDRTTPEIPIYGNKVLANREGVLELHGQVRKKTWTVLESPIAVGATTLTVKDDIDWVAGEVIVVASTSFVHTEAEVRTIASVSGKTLTVTKPFQFKHYAATETYGDKTIEIRAEVGLLTRNVVVRGSDQGLDTEHGATIMNFSRGDETTQARLSYIEVYNAGQAASLGRYAINFHLIGTVHKSYVRGCSIHHTFNRAVTIHGVYYLKVQDNVTYNTKGHTIFIEDAIETKNLIENNLIISVRRSWSLLNTDTTPAGIWITNPDNFFRNNHVAGGDAYGFWFDLKNNPTGPSYTDTVCPLYTKLGEFTGNLAHSMGNYGLRIYQGHIPLKNPCKKNYDSTAADPWATNPSVTAVYEGFTAYKCRRDGAIGEKMGDVQWVNFKVADNLLAGLEMTYTTYSRPYASTIIKDALVIGNSGNKGSSNQKGAVGLITPQTDGLIVENVKFYNFDDNQFPLGDASHSYSITARDTGARLTKLSKLSFTNSHKKIKWGTPPTGFFEITDSSLTGTAGAYVAAYWPHLLTDQCKDDRTTFNSVVCDGTTKIRRVTFHSIVNMNIFYFKDLAIRRTSGANIPVKPTTRRFLAGSEPDYLYSQIPMQKGGAYKSPSQAWSIPLVTGHEYRMSWGNSPIDWTSLKINTEQFDSPIDWVHLHLNFTDQRENFISKRGTVPAGTNTAAPGYIDPTIIPLSTTALSPSMVSGTARFDNITTFEVEIMINGIDDTNHKGSTISLEGIRCVGDHCNSAAKVEEVVVKEATVRKWSNPASWPSGKIPVDGDSVTILPEWDMLLDTNTAVLNHLEVNGILTFDTTKSVTLNSHTIHIRRGVVNSGKVDAPVDAQFSHQIVLHGTFTSTAFAFDPYVEVVNKALVVTGELNMFGATRQLWKRLTQNAMPGEIAIFVEKGGWKLGDQIVITQTGFNIEEHEVFTVLDVSGADTGVGSDSLWQSKETTRKFGKHNSEVITHTVVASDATNSVKLTLDKPLTYYHSGTAMLVAGTAIEMRAEVGILSSNVKISGTENDWPCNIVVADYIDFDAIPNPVTRSGTVNLNNVEIDYCGQKDTIRAGLRFEKNTKASSVTNSIVKRSQTYAVYMDEASKVTLKGNVFYKATRFGVCVMSAQEVVLDSNLMIYTVKRDKVELKYDKPTSYLICPEKYASCGSVTVTNNVAAGYGLIGFNYGSYQCGGTSSASNNLAHTGVIGLLVEHFSPSCNEVDSFTAVFNSDAGVLGAQNSKEVRFKGIKSAENFLGFITNVGIDGDSGLIGKVTGSTFTGRTVHSSCDPTKCSTDLGCLSRSGIGTGTFGASKGFSLFGMFLLPLSGLSRDAAFSGVWYYDDIYLGNFNNNSECQDKSEAAIVSNPGSPDFTAPQIFSNVRLENIAEGALFYMNDPSPGWANLNDCNEFSCTAPLNVIVRDTDGTLSPSVPSLATYLLPNNAGVTLKSACTFVAKSNGYICRKTSAIDFDYAILMFESLDADRKDRTFSPIYVTSDEFVLSATDTKYYNKLNTFMDHLWDGFYTSQSRLSRFPSIMPMNRFLNLTATGTWPKSMRFHIVGGDDFRKASVVTITYQQPNMLKLEKNGVEVTPLRYEEGDAGQVHLNSTSGTYKWFYDVRKLQFNIQPGDILTLKTTDSIQLSVRMDMTPEQFFADNGVTNFIDRLAAALNIPSYRIRVASVRRGSTIVDVNIVADSSIASAEESKTELERLVTEVQEKTKDGTLVLNGPILSVSAAYVSADTSVETEIPDTFTPEATEDAEDDNTSGSSNDDDDDSKKKLPMWGIIVVAVGGFAVLVLIGVVAFFVFRRAARLKQVDASISPEIVDTSFATTTEIIYVDHVDHAGKKDAQFEDQFFRAVTPQYKPKTVEL